MKSRLVREAGVSLFFAPVYAGDRGINQQSGIRHSCPASGNSEI